MEWNEEEISRIFANAKRADEENAPTFERTLTRSRIEPQRLRITPWGYGGSLALLLILSATFFLRSPSPSSDSPALAQIKPALLEWRSPTDFLLRTPGHELRDHLPEVGRLPELAGNNHQSASHWQKEKP